MALYLAHVILIGKMSEELDIHNVVRRANTSFLVSVYAVNF